MHPDVDTPDSELDRLAGVRGPLVAESSGRFHDEPRFRSSSAFDGDPRTAWTGIWARPSAPYPWIEWSADRARSLSSLRLVPGDRRARRATAVRLEWPGGATGRLAVGRDGTVALPRPVRARRVRADRAGREPRRYPRGRDRVGRGARPGAAGGSAPGPAARALRRRARARGRHHRAPDPARDHRGARRRAAAACPRLLRHGIDGGGRAADQLPARNDVDRPAHAALARAGVRARARGRGAGGGPRHAARQLGGRSARCARRPGLARARRELLRGLAREVRRPRPRPRPAGERLRERLASTA